MSMIFLKNPPKFTILKFLLCEHTQERVELLKYEHWVNVYLPKFADILPAFAKFYIIFLVILGMCPHIPTTFID